MPHYRFYFADGRGGILGHSVAELRDDASAEVHADKLLADSLYPGIEVWDRARLLYRKMRDDDTND